MANDFNISLLAGLDVNKSKEQIDKDINAIKSNISKLEVEAKISPDTAKNITSQLNNLQVGLKGITIDKATLDRLVNQINSALKDIKIGNISVNVCNQAQNIGRKIGQQVNNEVTQAVSNAVSGAKRSFNELNSVIESKLSFIKDTNGQTIPWKVDTSNVEALFNGIRDTFSEFGQVKITNQIFDENKLKSFRVGITQTNGNIKDTRNFMVEVSKYGKMILTQNKQIKGSQTYVKAYTSEIDKSLNSVSKLKSQWEQQGIYVDEFKTKIETLETTFKNLQIGDVDGLNSAKQQIGELVAEANRLKQIDKISFGLDTDSYNSKVEQLVTKTEQWVDSNGQARISTVNLSEALKNLQTAYETLNQEGGNTESNQKALIEAEKQLNGEIKTVTSSITSMNASLAKSSQVDALKQKIQKFYDTNTATHGKWGTELKRMLSDLNNEAGVTIEKFNSLGLELNGIENSARRAGKLGLSFIDTIKQGIKSFGYWTSATATVMKGITAIRQGVSTVTSLDTALVDLRKTTSMTSDELKQFYYEANDVAKQMGVTTEEIINQASAWSRLGYSTAEASTQMAKLSSQFKLISPGMTSDEATNGLVSVMKAYKMGVDDVKDGIMSPINIVGNNFALDNTNIVNMLQDSVSAMAEANNTLEETIALETAAFEITQDENVGNGFKTVALRLRGISEEGEEVDGTLQNIKSDLYDLTGVSIMQDANTYKSTYQILKEISDVWDDLSDKKQAKIFCLYVQKCA